jgi:hypothetical protein
LGVFSWDVAFVVKLSERLVAAVAAASVAQVKKMQELLNQKSGFYPEFF